MNVRIEFAYEPILFTRTGAAVAYEQLARLPGARDASWLTLLEPQQRSMLDAEACLLAEHVARKKCIPVFLNCFPDSVEAAAYAVHDNAMLALEVHEATPLEVVERIAREYRRLWLVLDDVTDRGRYATVSRRTTADCPPAGGLLPAGGSLRDGRLPPAGGLLPAGGSLRDSRLPPLERLIASEWLAHKPLWVKLPVHRTENTLYGDSADLDLGQNLPRSWTVIQEGVQSDELIACWYRGMLYAQGRRLPGGFRVQGDLVLDLPSCNDLPKEEADEPARNAVA